MIISFVFKYKQTKKWIKKLKDFFPESLGQKCGYILYMGTYYTWQNTVSSLMEEIMTFFSDLLHLVIFCLGNGWNNWIVLRWHWIPVNNLTFFTHSSSYHSEWSQSQSASMPCHLKVKILQTILYSWPFGLWVPVADFIPIIHWVFKLATDWFITYRSSANLSFSRAEKISFW